MGVEQIAAVAHSLHRSLPAKSTTWESAIQTRDIELHFQSKSWALPLQPTCFSFNFYSKDTFQGLANPQRVYRHVGVSHASCSQSGQPSVHQSSHMEVFGGRPSLRLISRASSQVGEWTFFTSNQTCQGVWSVLVSRFMWQRTLQTCKHVLSSMIRYDCTNIRIFQSMHYS